MSSQLMWNASLILVGSSGTARAKKRGLFPSHGFQTLFLQALHCKKGPPRSPGEKGQETLSPHFNIWHSMRGHWKRHLQLKNPRCTDLVKPLLLGCRAWEGPGRGGTGGLQQAEMEPGLDPSSRFLVYPHPVIPTSNKI